MANYYITRKAVGDLDSIWEYTLKKWSERQADIYYSALVSAFKEIANQPGHLDREYTEIHRGLFCRHCRKHLIFYKIVECNKVEIVRVLHERMDLRSKF